MREILNGDGESIGFAGNRIADGCWKAGGYHLDGRNESRITSVDVELPYGRGSGVSGEYVVASVGFGGSLLQQHCS